MREIVSVQVGGFANFVGSHFWNFQDELLGLSSDPDSDPIFWNQSLNMDVLYRTGETHQGNVSHTPRMVSVDFQGSLGSMSSRGTLYDESSSSEANILTWDGNVSTLASEPRKKNLFLQRLYEEEGHENLILTNGGDKNLPREIDDKDVVESLEKVVEYWTDYSKVHYHPRSLYELTGLWMEPQEFDNYGIGNDALSGGFRGEEINERIRLFVEECDHIQGFQFVVDDSGGFSAVASELLENIADEYGNTPVVLYSVRGPSSHSNPKTRNQIVSKNLHDAVSFSKLSSFCKLIVPIGLPLLSSNKASKFLSVKDEKPYHCSAVYGAALYAATLPFLMELHGPTAADSHNVSGSMDVNGLVQILTAQARNNSVCIMDIAMPSPSLSGTLLGNLHPLTPEIDDGIEDFQAVETITSLGAFSSGVNRASVLEVNAAVETAYKRAETRPIFCHLSVARCPLPIPLPFPSIFSSAVGQHGELLGSSGSGSSLDVCSVPVASRLRSSSAVLPFLENRLGKLRRYGTERGAPGAHLLQTWGFAQDELEDMCETLSKRVAALKPDSALSSDSD